MSITSTSEIAQASQALTKKDIQVMWVAGDNTVMQGFSGVAKVANNAKIPLIINDPEFVSQGALAAIGIGWYQTGKAAAKIAVKVFKGEDTKNIPFENVAVKKVVINNQIAKLLGITFPAEIVKDAEVSK